MLECTHRYIDTGGLTCLNERGSGTVAKVFKPWDQRLDRTAVHPSALVSQRRVIPSYAKAR